MHAQINARTVQLQELVLLDTQNLLRVDVRHAAVVLPVHLALVDELVVDLLCGVFGGVDQSVSEKPHPPTIRQTGQDRQNATHLLEEAEDVVLQVHLKGQDAVHELADGHAPLPAFAPLAPRGWAAAVDGLDERHGEVEQALICWVRIGKER